MDPPRSPRCCGSPPNSPSRRSISSRRGRPCCPHCSPRRAGGERAAGLLELALAAFGQHSDWAALSEILRRLAAGERDGQLLLEGLDAVDTAIAQRALEVLDGRVEVDRGAWHALSSPPDSDDSTGVGDSTAEA